MTAPISAVEVGGLLIWPSTPQDRDLTLSAGLDGDGYLPVASTVDLTICRLARSGWELDAEHDAGNGVMLHVFRRKDSHGKE